MRYGARMKQLIKDAGYGQNAFAEKMNISSSKMSFWCNAEFPPLEAIEQVCNALDIPIYKFFLNDEDLKSITGVDPRWFTIAQLVEQMPEDVQLKIMTNILQVIEMMESTLAQYKDNIEKNIEERHSR